MRLFRPRALPVVAVALAASLLGCSGEVATGVVSDKSYRAAFSWVQMVPVGKSLMPVTHYVPERFELLVDSDDGDVWVSVDETTFHEVEVGDWYGGDSE